MGCADFGSRKHVPLRSEPLLGQVREDTIEASPHKSGHVLQEDVAGSNLAKHTGDIGPDPALVRGAAALAGMRERLAREPRRDEIHDATPRSAVEGGKVVPDRSRIQGRWLHPRHEDGRSEGFPFDVTHTAVVITKGEMESEFEAADPGT
jgi:hypothetical protein